MTIEVTLPTRAFSINAYFYATRKVKTKEAKAWEESVLELLDEEKCFDDMMLEYKARGGTFAVHMELQYPHHEFFNKQGEVSAKTFDCSNWEKPLLDLLFGGRMQINDRFVTELHSRKSPGVRHQIIIRIQLL